MLSYEKYKDHIAGMEKYVDATPNRRFAAIIRTIPAGSRVLDVACGSGTVMKALEAKGCTVTGIDIAPGAIAIAKSKGLNVVHGDIDSFRTDETVKKVMLAEYDTVIFSKVLAYLKNKNELVRALNAKNFIVNQRNPGYWKLVLKRLTNRVTPSNIENLPYISARGEEIPQKSLRDLCRWGESYGFKSKVLLGSTFKGLDAVTLFYR